MKDHLRKSLTEMKSGVNNPEGGEGATVQDENLMMKLMESPSWKAPNVLRVRDSVSNGFIHPINFAAGAPSEPSTPPVKEAEGSSIGPGNLTEPPRPPPTMKDKPSTKSQNLKQARDDISRMLTEFTRISQCSQDDSGDAKMLTKLKAAMMNSKKQEHDNKAKEAETRREGQARQNVLAEIAILEKMKSIGRISENEFCDKLKVVFGV